MIILLLLIFAVMAWFTIGFVFAVVWQISEKLPSKNKTNKTNNEKGR